MDIKCSECEVDYGVDYLFKDGRTWIPVCESCLSQWLIDEARNNNDVHDIDDLDDEDVEELEKNGELKA